MPPEFEYWNNVVVGVVIPGTILCTTTMVAPSLPMAISMFSVAGAMVLVPGNAPGSLMVSHLQMPGTASTLAGLARLAGITRLATSISIARIPNMLGYLVFINSS
jgi:hypothetical protein